MAKRKIKVFSLSDKLKVVSACEDGKSRNEILAEFSLPESTYYKIIKDKDSIKSQCSAGYGNIKRNRAAEFPDVEKCLMEWITQALDKNLLVDGPMLKGKAQEFAAKLGMHKFAASNGWFEGFKKRHSLIFNKAAVESKSVNQGVCNHWTENLPTRFIVRTPRPRLAVSLFVNISGKSRKIYIYIATKASYRFLSKGVFMLKSR